MHTNLYRVLITNTHKETHTNTYTYTYILLGTMFDININTMILLKVQSWNYTKVRSVVSIGVELTDSSHGHKDACSMWYVYRN